MTGHVRWVLGDMHWPLGFQIFLLSAQPFLLVWSLKQTQRKQEYEAAQLQWASLKAQLVKNPPVMQETPVRFLGLEDPLEKG